jgi:hypothetical protein
MKHIDFTIEGSGNVKYDTNGLIVEGENNVTRLTVLFPLEYEGFSKYIIFHTKKGVPTEEGNIKSIEVKLNGSYFDLPYHFVNAVIEEIAFRAVDDSGTVFATVKTAFPPVNEALLPDSAAAMELSLTGIHIEAGENIEITKRQVDCSGIIQIGLKRPLQNPLETSEINGLGEAVYSKIDEVAGKPNGLAMLDQNAKIPPESLQSNILVEYTVPAEIGADEMLFIEGLNIKAGDTVEFIVEGVSLGNGAGIYFPESEENWITVTEFFYIGQESDYPLRCNVFFGKDKIVSTVFMDYMFSGSYQYIQYFSAAPTSYPQGGIQTLIFYASTFPIPAGTKIWLIRR